MGETTERTLLDALELDLPKDETGGDEGAPAAGSSQTLIPNPYPWKQAPPPAPPGQHGPRRWT